MSTAASNLLLSGGEDPELAKEIFRIRRIMKEQKDVHRVLDLSYEGLGIWFYLIETPFATFPKFVIGKFDSATGECQILLQCGMEWNACEKWARILDGKPLTDD